MTITPKLRAWLVDAGERVGSTFLAAFLGSFGLEGISAMVGGHIDMSAVRVAEQAGAAAVLALVKAALAARVNNTVSPASLAPQQQPGQAESDAPGPAASAAVVTQDGHDMADGTCTRCGQTTGTTWPCTFHAALPPPSGRKLGRKPLTADSRDLKLARYITAALPAPPRTVAWQKAVAGFPMLLNDRIGDCVIAGMLHQQQIWAAVAGNPTFTPTDAQALALYRQITGYDPADPSSDQGTDPRDALRTWKATGAAGHKILAYAAVDPTDHQTVKQAISLFGGLGVCLNLPKYAETERGEWLLKKGAGAVPGSWGGHWVCAAGYNRTGIQLVTWGEVWTLTWGFLDRYCDGLFAAISPDWMTAAGTSPSGLDLRALNADLTAI